LRLRSRTSTAGTTFARGDGQGGRGERERRASIVAAEGEYQAAVKLGKAATSSAAPVALQLSTLQDDAEIGSRRIPPSLHGAAAIHDDGCQEAIGYC